MQHPNFFDSIALRIHPRYLYKGQLAWAIAKINIGIVHKVLQAKPSWKIMDNLLILKGSTLRYLGLARDLKITGDIPSLYSIFELVNAVTADSVDYQTHHASPGDTICVSDFDRKFIYPAPIAITPQQS